jgi:hypothetical protein
LTGPVGGSVGYLVGGSTKPLRRIDRHCKGSGKITETLRDFMGLSARIAGFGRRISGALPLLRATVQLFGWFASFFVRRPLERRSNCAICWRASPQTVFGDSDFTVLSGQESGA